MERGFGTGHVIEVLSCYIFSLICFLGEGVTAFGLQWRAEAVLGD